VVGTDRALVQISAVGVPETLKTALSYPSRLLVGLVGWSVASWILYRIFAKVPHSRGFSRKVRKPNYCFVNSIAYHELSKIIDISDADFPDKTKSS
jgi:hypothetical protein